MVRSLSDMYKRGCRGGSGKKCNQIGVILSKHLLYNLASVCLSWCGLDENCERKNRDKSYRREQADHAAHLLCTPNNRIERLHDK